MSLRLARHAPQWLFRLRGPCRPAASDALSTFPETLAVEPERAPAVGMEASMGASLLRGIACAASVPSRLAPHAPSTACASASPWNQNRSSPGLSSHLTLLHSSGSNPASSLSLEAAAVQSPKALAASGQPTLATTEDPDQEQEASSLVSRLEEALGGPFDDSPTVAPHEGLVVVISGPSGVGKDAVIRRLQEVRPSLHFVVTATSRAMRPGEVHGQDYFFVTRDEFETLIEAQELLEHAVVYGEYKGIPKQQIREAVERQTDVVLRLDVQGAATVRRLLGGGGVFIFLTAESERALVRRLVGRKTEPMERLMVRVATARDELARLEEFDYVVVNQDGCLDDTVNALCSIIDAEKARVQRRPAQL